MSNSNLSSAIGELRDFHAFIGAQLATTDQLTPEDLLDLWRDQHPQEDDAADVAKAVRAALDDLAAGDIGTPFAEFDREFRTQHGLPPRT